MNIYRKSVEPLLIENPMKLNQTSIDIRREAQRRERIREEKRGDKRSEEARKGTKSGAERREEQGDGKGIEENSNIPSPCWPQLGCNN